MTFNKQHHQGSILFLVLILNLVCGSDSMAGFVDTGQGARPIGLGRAYTAVASDVHSIFYNPAGLGNLNRLALTTMYARLFPGITSADLHYEMMAASIPLSFMGRIGVAITNFNLDIYQENMIYFSYGRQLPFHLAIGGNVKLLRWSAEGDVDPISGIPDKKFSKNSLAFDVGVIYQPSLSFLEKWLKTGRLQLGLMLKDINQPNISESGSSSGKLPLGFAAGIGYLSDQITIAADLSRSQDFTRLHLGAEYLLQRLKMGAWNFALLARAGGIRVLNDRKGGEVDFGFGLLVKTMQVDYVYVYPLVLKDVDGSHKISLSFQF